MLSSCSLEEKADWYVHICVLFKSVFLIIYKLYENTLEFFHLYLQSTIWNESKGRLMQALSPPASPKRDGSPSSSNSSHNDEDQTRCGF